MSDDPPKRLFKFRSWKDEKHRLILEQNLLWFASPEKFNDPFDCKIHVCYEQMPPEDKLQYARHLAQQKYPQCNEAEIRAKEAVQRFSNLDQGQIRALHAKREKLLAEKHGVLSFAGVHDNILLWSHYADSHKGFCVEFDGERLAELFASSFDTDRHIIMPFRVKYSHDYPTLIPTVLESDDMSDDFYDKVLTYKSDQWEYEKEFRFIYADGTNKAIWYAPDAVVAVYLGCSMPDSDRQEIKQLVKDRFSNSALYQAKTKLDEFELEFDLV